MAMKQQKPKLISRKRGKPIMKKSKNALPANLKMRVSEVGTVKLPEFMLRSFFKKKTVKSALEKILKSSNAHMLSVWARDSATNKIEFVTGAGKHKKEKIHKEKQAMEILLKKNKICAIDINKEQKMKNLPFVKENKLVSSVVIPMKAGEENIGIILLYNQKYTDLGLSKLNKLFYTEMMAIQNEYLKERIEVLLNTANIDSLTKLYNHRAFYETLIKEISKANRFKYPLSVLMIDIDHFKKFNDKYGHIVGDKVLYVISEIIRDTIRAYDIPFRYGGEEIAIICPYTNRHQALAAAERIRKNVEDYVFDANGGTEKVKLTVSIGLSSYPENAIFYGDLVKKADEALYLAKEEGRNRVCPSLITRKDKIRFAFCPPTLSPFYFNVLRGVREVAEEVGSVDVVVLASSSESSYKEQLQLMHKAIKDKVDAIGLCSKQNVGDVVIKANKAKIPIFVFNVNELDMTPRGEISSFICYEQKEAGAMVGDFISRILRTKGNVAIIEGIPDESDSIDRKKGFMETVKKHSAIKILESRPANWDRNKAKLVAEDLLRKHPNIDAFFCLSDEMALGAVDAVKEAGKINKIFVIGLDGNKNAIQSIKNGELFATLNTNPVGMGKIMMRTVLRSTIREEVISPVTKSPIMIIDSQNVEPYL
ncbi:MAG: diguanylate cyclase [Candidatus Ratteibacteria bacterium]|nr:diguanylate cyclase [Candidatus Ratteibacteria bacterium]